MLIITIALARLLAYRLRRFQSCGIRRMIICSCNVLTDHDVRSAVSSDASVRSAYQVYGCLGCSPQCGRCATTIKRLLDEAVGGCQPGCGCPRHGA